jgi:uncharacterized protein
MLLSRFTASASQGHPHLWARQRQTYRSQERCRITQLALASRTDAYHARKVLGMKWFARSLALIFCSLSVNAHAQSFSCRSAKTPDEIAICQNKVLSELDEQMDTLFLARRAALSESQQALLTAQQQSWLRERMTCAADVSCIENAYRKRISQLAPNPPHVRTQITEVFTGWNADQFGIFTVDPVVNPANCKRATGYMTDGDQPGYRTFYAAALAAFAQRATVIVVVDETRCIEDHPKLIGLNILRFP